MSPACPAPSPAVSNTPQERQHDARKGPHSLSRSSKRMGIARHTRGRACGRELTVKVRCVLCTRFFRPGVALAAAPELADGAAAAAAAARAGCAGAEEAGVAPGAGANGLGTSPPVPGGAKGVTARRKVRAVAWILPSATKTSPCGHTCTGASSQTRAPRQADPRAAVGCGGGCQPGETSPAHARRGKNTP